MMVIVRSAASNCHSRTTGRSALGKRGRSTMVIHLVSMICATGSLRAISAIGRKAVGPLHSSEDMSRETGVVGPHSEEI